MNFPVSDIMSRDTKTGVGRIRTAFKKFNTASDVQILIIILYNFCHDKTFRKFKQINPGMKLNDKNPLYILLFADEETINQTDQINESNPQKYLFSFKTC
jgi:hypothetical protein